MAKQNFWSEKGRGAYDLTGYLYQIMDLRFEFDSEIREPTCDTICKDRLDGCTVEDVHDFTTDTEQAKSPEKMEALMDSGTHTCHLCAPAEVAVYMHTQILDRGDLAVANV